LTDDTDACLSYKATPESSRTRIPVDTFRRALLVAGVTADLEEVECILANMIFKASSQWLTCCWLLTRPDRAT
jgi:hypothetical protein